MITASKQKQPGSVTGRKAASQEDQIRARLLNRLGIYDSPSVASTPTTAAQSRRLRILRGMGVGYTIRPSPPDGSAVRDPLGGAKPHQEPLKNRDEAMLSSPPPSPPSLLASLVAKEPPKQERERPANAVNTDNHGSIQEHEHQNKKKKKSTRIAFSDEVSVIPIPMRTEYSERIKSRIWSNRYELHENAQRNALEFAAEGWNWENVTEDEGMYICSVSGELVHPVHCQHLATEQPPSLERGAPVHG